MKNSSFFFYYRYDEMSVMGAIIFFFNLYALIYTVASHMYFCVLTMAVYDENSKCDT